MKITVDQKNSNEESQITERTLEILGVACERIREQTKYKMANENDKPTRDEIVKLKNSEGTKARNNNRP